MMTSNRSEAQGDRNINSQTSSVNIAHNTQGKAWRNSRISLNALLLK